MSREIDERVVEMEFDNSNFEKNVQTSMKTLDELQSTLDRLPENSGKGLSALANAANNIDLSGISEAIETINYRFSTMGIVGQEIITKITDAAIGMVSKVSNATLGQIKTGGLARASNIEKAKFTIQGMGLDFEKVDKSITDAVTDTAFGYDEAAMAASQLVSSNVSLGTEMDRALKSISGVAAMTNSSYSEIADIYTTAASLNKVTGDMWNRLAARGLNAKAVLAESLGKTQEEITNMTSKGKIDFKTFSDAMYDAFAEHASEANNTFNGVISNIKAALSKMGQSFYQPLIANGSPLVMMLGEVKNRLNEIKKYMDPATKVVTDYILKLSASSQTLLKNLNLKPVEDFFNHVKNSLENLISTIGSIKTVLAPFNKNMAKAFENIFPKKIDIGEGIESASKKLKIFVEEWSSTFSVVDSVRTGEKILKAFSKVINGIASRSDKLKNIVKGLSSGLSIVLKIVKSLGIASKPLFNQLNSFGTKVLDSVIDGLSLISDKLNTLNNSPALKELTDKIEKFDFSLKNIDLSSVIKNLKNGFKSIFDNISASYADGGGSLKIIFDSLANGVRLLSNGFTKLTGIDISGFTEKIVTGMQNARNTIVDFVSEIDIFDKVKSAFSGIKSILKQFISVFNKDLANPVPILNLTVLVYTFSQLALKLKAFKAKVGFFVNLINGFKVFPKQIFNNIKSTLVSFQRELKSKTLMTIASSIAILAASIWVLASIDSTKLGAACAAMAGLITAIAGIYAEMNVLNNSSIKGNIGISTLGTNLIKLSVAVLILANAMKGLDSLKNIDTDILALMILVGVLVLVAEAMKFIRPESFSKVATSMILLAAGIKILTSAMAQIDQLDNTLESIASIIVLIGVVAGFIKLMDMIEPAGFAKTAVGIILLASGIKILASAVSTMGGMDFNNLVQGMIGLVAALVLMIGIVKVLSNVKGFEKTAIGLLILGEAIKLVSSAFVKMSEIPLDAMVVSMLMFIMVLGSLAILCTSLSGDLITAGAGLILVAIAMNTLVSAIATLGNMDILQLVQGIGALAVAILVIGGACKILESSIAGAAAFLIVAAGLRILVPAIEQIGSMDLWSLAKAIAGIAAAIVVLTVGCYAMVECLPGAAAMLVVSAALLALGVALGIIGSIGLETIAKSLIGFAAAMLTFAGLSLILTPVLGSMAALSGVMLLIAAAVGIFGAGLAVMAVAMQLLGSAGSIGAVGMMAFINAVLPFLDELAEMVAIFAGLAVSLLAFDAALLLLAAGCTVAGAALTILSAGLIAFSAAALIAAGTMLLIKTMLVGGFNDIKTVLDSKKFKEIGANVMTALFNAIKTGISKVIQAIKELGRKIIDSIKSFAKDAINAGSNFVKGFIKGIKNSIGSAVKACKELGSKALSALKNKLSIHSPSKETEKIAKYFDAGFVKGLINNAKSITDTTEEIGDSALDSIKEALQKVNDTIDDDTNDLTITPVIDLTNAQNSAKILNSMFNREQAATISTNFDANRKYEVEQAAWSNAQLQKIDSQLAKAVEAIDANSNQDVNVNISLEGDAKNLFKSVRHSNNQYKKMHGKSALA